MERDDFAKLSPTEPATVLIGDSRHHFGALRDALVFARQGLPPTQRGAAWVLVDRGLIAPEELEPVAARIVA